MKRYEYNYGKNPEGALSTISGYATETTNFGETAFGILNKSTRDEENFTTPEVVSSSTATLFSVGNGTDHDSRKNIIELKADGTVYINGVGQYDGTNPGEATDIADEFQGIHDDITGLNEDVDRIDNTIESIHISEDDENLIYTLLVDGQERGTINIPRDQFLKNVSYNEETNNLEFTFIVRGENNEEVEKQINVNMTDLEDIYSAGDGLNLENKQFSVKVDADTQPYIEVTANGVKVIGINEALDNKVSWDETKTVITIPANGSISALRNNGLEGGVLVCQRTCDEGATYTTEIGTTKNSLTLNSTQRPKIDFADGTSENIAYQSEITDINQVIEGLDNIYATKEELNQYVPLEGNSTILGSLRVLNGENSALTLVGDTLGAGTPGMAMKYNGISIRNNYSDESTQTLLLSESGIAISGKTDNDLLNAAGGTTSIDDITSQIDLTPYATKEEVGSNIYTDSNYLSKETNLTDAVLQLDEEIKATNDNLDLEHANAEATYAKKTELDGYLPLSGGILTGTTEIHQDGFQLCLFGGVDGIIQYNENSNVIFTLQPVDNGSGCLAVYDKDNSDIRTSIKKSGVTISGKTTSDLLNAGGSTTPISDIVTQVQSAIVDSAPETLDTLNELAAALGDDPNFATTVTNLIGTKVDNSKWETIANTNIVTSIDDFSYAEDSIQLNHKFILKNDNGSFDAESQTGKTINAATSTTAGVMSAADFKKLSNITLGDNGISQIDFDSFSDDTSYIKSYKRDGSNNGTTLEIHVEDNTVGADTDLDYIDFTQRGYGEENSTVVARISSKKLLSLNPTTNQLERVANISELPTIQSGQNGITSNYVYSSAADEGYRVLSDISCTRTGDVVKLQGRTWGMPSNSSLDLVTLPLASSSMAGLMSTTDKSKLDKITITDGDIVASGFRIYGGTADEVLTADGDSNTLKTIDGQTLLGSGDVDMSPYFKLNEDNTVWGDTVFGGDMHIQSGYGGSGISLFITADSGDTFIGCSNGNGHIVTISSNKLSTYGLVRYPTFYMIAEQANAGSSSLYQKVMFSIDRDEDGLTRLSLGNFDESEDGDDIIRGTESYITSNGIKLPSKNNRDFLVGDGTTVGLSDLSDEIVMTTGDQVINGSKRFNKPIETASIRYNNNADSPNNTFLYYYNSMGTYGNPDDYTILHAYIIKDTFPYQMKMKIDSIEMSNSSGTLVRLSSESGGYLNLGSYSDTDNPSLKISSDGLTFKGRSQNELINAAGGFTSADTFVKTSSGSKTIWTGTQSAYEAVAPKDADTLYFITED